MHGVYIQAGRDGAGRPAQDDGQPLDITKERGRLIKAKADLAELELKKGRGEVILISEVDTVWQEMASAVRSHMLALPNTVAPIVAGETNVMTIRKMIEAAMHEALEELARIEVEVEPADSG